MPRTKKVKEEEVVETEVVETVSEEKVESKVKATSAKADCEKYAVYINGRIDRVYTRVNHGDDFIEIAEAHAKSVNGTAAEYSDPVDPEPEKNVVNIVNVNGNFVRQFTLKVHGEDYVEIANAYIKKHGESKGLKIG